MKAVFVALFAILAVSSAQVLLGSPLGYSAPLIAPYGYGLQAVAPVAYAAPAIQTGYVAATRGSVHTAPLPQGPLAFSHHINTAPAPGTL